jgi:hypothetical protein
LEPTVINEGYQSFGARLAPMVAKTGDQAFVFGICDTPTAAVVPTYTVSVALSTPVQKCNSSRLYGIGLNANYQLGDGKALL